MLDNSDVQSVSLDKLHFDPHNARVHPADNLAALRESLATFGQPEPLIVGKDGMVIAGNGRLAAMLDLGWKECLVNFVDWDERKCRAYSLTANRTGELATWNVELLAPQVVDLRIDYNMDGAGFSDEELARITTAAAPQEDDALSKVLDTDALDEADIDDAPSIVQPGQVWRLGAHRVMCGDSTAVQDVARLMGDERADIVFTSPPYDQQRDYGAKIGDWQALMRGVFGNLRVTDDAQVLVNLGLVHRDGEWVPYWDEWIGWMRAQGWRRFGWYVWDQGAGLPGDWSGRPAPSHEFVFHLNKSSRRANKTLRCKHAGEIHTGKGLRNKDGVVGVSNAHGMPCQETKVPDSVFRVTRQKGSDGHPAQFPVALPAYVYASFCEGRALTYEPFLGSGTSIIAAEQIGRRCCGMEIHPPYCDIAIARWEKLTGQKAVLL